MDWELNTTPGPTACSSGEDLINLHQQILETVGRLPLEKVQNTDWHNCNLKASAELQLVLIHHHPSAADGWVN